MYTVAFEAFTVNGEYSIAELAILDINGNVSCHCLLKQRQNFNALSESDQRRNRHLSFNHHHIFWSDGYVTSDIKNLLDYYIASHCHVVCKGLQVKNHLKKLRNDLVIHDIDTMCKKPLIVKKECNFHYRVTQNCAFNKACNIYNAIHKQ